MALDAILTVAGLAAGASVVVAHTIGLGGVDLTPNFIAPDRPTPIRVATATATSVTFTNDGTQTESAFFHAKKDHSMQQAGSINLYWQGYAGFTSFKLSATQWDDLRVPNTNFRAGATAPTLTVFLGGTRMLLFAAGDEAEMAVQLPHGWAEGTTLRPHVHLSFPNANAGNYVFGLEYTVQNINGVFPGPTTIETAVTAAPGVANTNTKVLLPDIDMTGKNISSMVIARLYRKTGVASAYAAGIFVAEFDFHYQIDTLGSRQELVK